NRQTDDVRVLLKRGGGDLLGRLPQAGIDDLHPGIPQSASDDFRSTVVTVESRLRDDHPELTHPAARHSWLVAPSHYTIATSSYSPQTSRSASHISPTVAYARTASRMEGITFCFARAASP